MAAHQTRRAVRIVDDLFDLCAGSLDSLPLCKEEADLAAPEPAGGVVTRPDGARGMQRLRSQVGDRIPVDRSVE